MRRGRKLNIYNIGQNIVYFPYRTNHFNKEIENDVGVKKMEEMAKSSGFIVERQELHNRIFKTNNTAIALLANPENRKIKGFAITNTIKEEVLFLDLIVLQNEIRSKKIGEKLIWKIFEQEKFKGNWLAIREWGTNPGFFNFIKKFGEFVGEETIPDDIVEETMKFKPEFERVYWIKLNSS